MCTAHASDKGNNYNIRFTPLTRINCGNDYISKPFLLQQSFQQCDLRLIEGYNADSICRVPSTFIVMMRRGSALQFLDQGDDGLCFGFIFERARDRPALPSSDLKKRIDLSIEYICSTDVPRAKIFVSWKTKHNLVGQVRSFFSFTLQAFAFYGLPHHIRTVHDFPIIKMLTRELTQFGPHSILNIQHDVRIFAVVHETLMQTNP